MYESHTGQVGQDMGSLLSSLIDDITLYSYNMLDISVITQSGDSALMIAAYYGYTKVIVELVYSGANLDLQNNVSQGVIFMWQ